MNEVNLLMNKYKIVCGYTKSKNFEELSLQDRRFFLGILKKMNYSYESQLELSYNDIQKFLFGDNNSVDIHDEISSLLYFLTQIYLKISNEQKILELPIFEEIEFPKNKRKITLNIYSEIEPFFEIIVKTTFLEEKKFKSNINYFTKKLYEKLLNESIFDATNSITMTPKRLRETLNISSGYKDSDINTKIFKLILNQFKKYFGDIQINSIKEKHKIISYQIFWDTNEILTAYYLNKEYNHDSEKKIKKSSLINVEPQFLPLEKYFLMILNHNFTIFPRRNYSFFIDDLFPKYILSETERINFLIILARRLFQNDYISEIFDTQNKKTFESISIENYFLNIRLTSESLKIYKGKSS